MPTTGIADRDPRKMERCRRLVAAAMLAQGWHKHARKFAEVQQRRALRLYWETP